MKVRHEPNLVLAIMFTLVAAALLIASLFTGCIKEEKQHTFVIKAGQQHATPKLKAQAYDKSYMLVSFYANPAWKYTPGVEDGKHRIWGYSDGLHEDDIAIIDLDYSSYSLAYQCDSSGAVKIYAYSNVDGVGAYEDPGRLIKPMGVLPLDNHYYLTLERKDGEIVYGVQGVTVDFTGYAKTPAGKDRPGYLLKPYSEHPVSHDREFQISYTKH